MHKPIQVMYRLKSCQLNIIHICIHTYINKSSHVLRFKICLNLMIEIKNHINYYSVCNSYEIIFNAVIMNILQNIKNIINYKLNSIYHFVAICLIKFFHNNHVQDNVLSDLRYSKKTDISASF
ncbi:hypothetical protein V1477_010341 [Vespula maculifrons]|uniref:Uncharacterized protein n=1 Tax=Vespula maculifrons TaxID=7453 RepID=A0ABD2C8X2_VESMC